MEYIDDNRIQEVSEGDGEPKPITTFDMKDAVEVSSDLYTYFLNDPQAEWSLFK